MLSSNSLCLPCQANCLASASAQNIVELTGSMNAYVSTVQLLFFDFTRTDMLASMQSPPAPSAGVCFTMDSNECAGNCSVVLPITFSSGTFFVMEFPDFAKCNKLGCF